MQSDDKVIGNETDTRSAARETLERPGARVLVVDDNEDAAMMMAAVLKAYGYQATTAPDGKEALDIVIGLEPAVALVDLGLPGMDGFELARRFRALPECHDMRLVAVTGYGQEQDRQRSALAGFDAHLVKPVDTDQLTHLLRQLIGSSSST